MEADRGSFPAGPAPEGTTAPGAAPGLPPPQTEDEKKKGRPQAGPSGDASVDARRERDRERKERQRSGAARPGPSFATLPPPVKGAATAVPGAVPEPAPSGQAVPLSKEAKVVNYQAMAEMTFNIVTGACCQMIGPEWAPNDEKEKATIVLPLAAYYQSKNLPDIPPGMLLCLTVTAYAAARTRTPNTREKLSRGWNWIRGRFGKKSAADQALRKAPL